MRISVAKHLIEKDISDDPNYFVQEILSLRNVDSAETFLHPPAPETFGISSFGIPSETIKKLFHSLETVKKRDQTVIVYTDYDADGITGGAILWETLHLLGFTALPYVPHRAQEGYGFSQKGIDAVFSAHRPGLIISVDHGIAGHAAISYAKHTYGLPIIVTDHHHRQKTLPEDAHAIIHIPALSGSGTAYYVAREIYRHFAPSMSTRAEDLNTRFATDYAGLAAIGTIADLVPLVGASRSIAHHGLRALSQSKRPGILALMHMADIDTRRPITPYEVGFQIAPRINAVGRLEHALDALRLLCTTNTKRAQDLAGYAQNINTARQDLVKEAVASAIERVRALPQLPTIIIVSDPAWHEGIIGLIASKLVETFYRPTMVVAESSDIFKASARSIRGFHLTNYLESLSGYFLGFGGHAQAAGFSMKPETFSTFVDDAMRTAESILTPEMLEREISVDLHVPASSVTAPVIDAISHLAPFGVGNPQPTFMSHVRVRDVRTMGKEGSHVKYQVEPITGGQTIDMVGFGMKEKFPLRRIGDEMHVIYQVSMNEWNGRRSPQGMMKHIVQPEDTMTTPT